MALRHLAHALVLALVVALGTTILGFYYYRAAGPLSEPTAIVFKKGMGFEEIVDNMAERGVIRLPLVFKLFAIASGDARKFKAGEYQFTAAISPKLVMDMIAEGRVVVRKLTIPEGLRTQEVIALLNEQGAMEGEITGSLPEGVLLPQTYHYTYGDSRQEMLQRMQAAMQTTLNELWAVRKEGLPLKTPQDALVLASIVERETGIAAERPRVAAVFINRLNKGMKLQSDPTVIYAVEKKDGALGRPLLRRDLNMDSPYNTYKYEGLPPTPIANPGRAALEAVLNPPDTKELYFVATGNGGHNFSESLKQHNENVQQYKEALKEQEKAKPAN